MNTANHELWVLFEYSYDQVSHKMNPFSLLDEACIGYICDILGGPYFSTELRATCRILKQNIRAPHHCTARELARYAICARPSYDWNLYMFAFKLWTQPIIERIQPEVHDDDRETCRHQIIKKASLRAIRWSARCGNLELCARIRDYAAIDDSRTYDRAVSRGIVRGGHSRIVRNLSESGKLNANSAKLQTDAGKSGDPETIEITMACMNVLPSAYHVASGAARVGNWDLFDRMEQTYTEHPRHKKMVFAAYCGNYSLFFDCFDRDLIDRDTSEINRFMNALEIVIKNGHTLICKEILTRIKPMRLCSETYESLLSAAAHCGDVEICTLVYDWIRACEQIGIVLSDTPELESITPNAECHEVSQTYTNYRELLVRRDETKSQDKLLEFAAARGVRALCEYAYFTLGATDICSAMRAAFRKDRADILILLRDWIVERDHSMLAVEIINFECMSVDDLCVMIARRWWLIVTRYSAHSDGWSVPLFWPRHLFVKHRQ